MNESKGDLESISTEYLEPTPDRVVDQRIFELISDFVIPRLDGRRVLELGVGDQVWTPKLISRFEEVTTVDACQNLLDQLSKQLDSSRWTPVCSFFEDYEPEERFDGMLATYVLEHVDSAVGVLERARTHWLRPGGRIAVVVPHALSLHRRLAVKMGLLAHPAELGETDVRMGHTRCYTCFEMERCLVEAGFSILEKHGMFSKLLPNRLMANFTDQQLKGMFDLGLDLPMEYSAAIYYLAEASS